MKAPICCALFFTLTNCFQIEAAPQRNRYVVVSPRVGVVIDSLGAATYKIFQTIPRFHSGSFVQAQDSSLHLVLKYTSADGVLRDSTFPMSVNTLRAYAERIEHWEGIAQGKYRIGTSEPHLVYEDGTPLIPRYDAFTAALLASDRVRDGRIPLAPNTYSLLRPKFTTIGFSIEIGMMMSNFSEMELLTGSSGNMFTLLSFDLQIPIVDDPSIFFIGGYRFALNGGGGSLTSFSFHFGYQPESNIFLKPIVGIGAGYTTYAFENSFIINALDVYPLLVFGLSIVPHTLDVLLTYPLTKGLQTTFESKSYTIKPAGYELCLRVSL